MYFLGLPGMRLERLIAYLQKKYGHIFEIEDEKIIHETNDMYNISNYTQIIPMQIGSLIGYHNRDYNSRFGHTRKPIKVSVLLTVKNTLYNLSF